MLTVSQLSKSFAGRALFTRLAPGQCGDGSDGWPEWAGKSTLFASSSVMSRPIRGHRDREERNHRFLPQETAAAGDETVLELALAVSPELVHAQKVIKEHEIAVAGIADPGADATYHNASMFLTSTAGGSSGESKTVLAGLAFAKLISIARRALGQLDHARISRACS